MVDYKNGMGELRQDRDDAIGRIMMEASPHGENLLRKILKLKQSCGENSHGTANASITPSVLCRIAPSQPPQRDRTTTTMRAWETSQSSRIIEDCAFVREPQCNSIFHKAIPYMPIHLGGPLRQVLQYVLNDDLKPIISSNYRNLKMPGVTAAPLPNGVANGEGQFASVTASEYANPYSSKGQDALLLHGPRERYRLKRDHEIPPIESDQELLVQVRSSREH